MTRSTVATLTPAARATAAMVGRLATPKRVSHWLSFSIIPANLFLIRNDRLLHTSLVPGDLRAYRNEGESLSCLRPRKPSPRDDHGCSNNPRLQLDWPRSRAR